MRERYRMISKDDDEDNAHLKVASPLAFITYDDLLLQCVHQVYFIYSSSALSLAYLWLGRSHRATD